MKDQFLGTTNAVKAQIITVVNAVFALLLVFGVNLNDAKQGAILVLINALFALWVGLTYTRSHKRVETG